MASSLGTTYVACMSLSKAFTPGNEQEHCHCRVRKDNDKKKKEINNSEYSNRRSIVRIVRMRTVTVLCERELVCIGRCVEGGCDWD